MNKYKYLMKNISIFAISEFGTKILSFFLIPLYTSILTTEEYGIYDFASTTVSLCIPILTVSITSAVVRYTLEKGIAKRETFNIGLRIVLKAIVIFLFLILLNEKIHLVELFENRSFFLAWLFCAMVLYDFVSQYCRGLEKVIDVAVAGIINSVTMLVFNIIFLVFLNMGLQGYFTANCAAYTIPLIYLFCRLKLWRQLSVSKVNDNLKREMVLYSKPIVVDTISWWINNVSDRYIVTWICGVATNGIYSVAYKIPSMLNIVQNVFNNAWTLSAVRENENGDSKFYQEIYAIYNCGMVVVCTVLLLLNKLIAKVLFAKDFYGAWRYAPFLMISVVFGALCGLLGGIFNAKKCTKIRSQTTMVGAIVNVVLNIVLVRMYGALGAAQATMIAYIVVWSVRLFHIERQFSVCSNFKRDIISYILLVIQASCQFVNNVSLGYGISVVVLLGIIVLYANETKKIFNKIHSVFYERRKEN